MIATLFVSIVLVELFHYVLHDPLFHICYDIDIYSIA